MYPFYVHTCVINLCNMSYAGHLLWWTGIEFEKNRKLRWLSFTRKAVFLINSGCVLVPVWNWVLHIGRFRGNFFPWWLKSSFKDFKDFSFMFALSGLTGGALMGSNPNTNTNNKCYKLLQDLPCRAQQTLAHGRLPYTQTAH